MTYPMPIAIKVKNYKSFGDSELSGIDELKKINLIIGRNNTGKSALLDLVKYVIELNDISALGHKGKHPEVFVTKPLLEQEIRQTFPDHTSGGPIGGDYFEYGKQWIGKPITVSLGMGGSVFTSIEPQFTSDAIKNEFGAKLASVFVNPTRGKRFRRLLADRDMTSETDATNPVLSENGQGATTIIQHFLNKTGRDPKLVEEKLLNALNEIFNPDAFFKRITTRQSPNGSWEVFLEEENKGSIQLSNSGSGLKTVILTLILIFLIPPLEGKELKDYIFAFEELENNLHPGLQRRLLSFIRKVATENDCCFVITTHSNIVIDLFSKDEEAQIIHVTHDGDCATTKTVKTYIDNKGVLDDLDVRASDLLQANGIIWVEGPSDRLYFNRWVELWSDGQLKEGSHYQCVFYGGRLLAHFSAHESDERQETVDILNINKNAFLIIDSDKENDIDTLNTTKQRMIQEIEDVGGKSWITAGREVENYIPKEAVAPLLGSTSVNQVETFAKFEEYLNTLKTSEGDKFLKNKVLFAEKILPGLTKENLESLLDIKEKIELAISEIKRWNNLT